ncbi:hypothetical protein BSFP_057040 [Burkholderia stabilis]|uniref:Uncharacterized protein n=1 Tax=Burkholderia stabilis TaxID=95485 RepID=A0A1Y1BUN0_9BURK|nr:hypothetical protein BSFP_057040 [Burkholderia stabilis]
MVARQSSNHPSAASTKAFVQMFAMRRVAARWRSIVPAMHRVDRLVVPT